MTIADIDERLKEIGENPGTCMVPYCPYERHDVRPGIMSHHYLSPFNSEIKALKALRAVLVLYGN